MFRKWWNLIKSTPVLVGASILTAQGAIAAGEVPETGVQSFSLPEKEQLVAQAAPPGTPSNVAPEAQQLLQMMQRSREGKRLNTQVYTEPMSQVTNVNQLQDVQPTAWAYEALRSLVERYGCIVGYPDRTFRGDRALTRWEFAAGLNACMNVLERLIQEGVALVREDLEKLKRLADEFAAELAALGARIDNLEARVAFLENHQFSTTTQLNGEVIFAYANASSDDFASDSTFEDRTPQEQEVLENNINIIGEEGIGVSRVRLNFDTSFTGIDRLRIRIESNTTPNFSSVTGSNMARLAWDTTSIEPNGRVGISDVWYRFPVIRNLTAFLGTRSMNFDDVFDLGNPFLQSSATGAISRFVRRNPLVFTGPDGNGVALRYKFSDLITVNTLYLADDNDATSPLQSRGVFNGNFSTGVQAIISPIKTLDLNLTYLHSYFREGTVNLSGDTGSRITQDPTIFLGLGATLSGWTRDSFGAQVDWQAFPWVHFMVWAGYAYAEAQKSGLDSYADIWTFNGAVSFIDLLKEGAILSLSVGVPPRIARLKNGSEDRDTSILVELQYLYPINNNILITPGFYAISNPNHFGRNKDIWVGVVRTTFTF